MKLENAWADMQLSFLGQVKRNQPRKIRGWWGIPEEVSARAGCLLLFERTKPLCQKLASVESTGLGIRAGCSSCQARGSFVGNQKPRGMSTRGRRYQGEVYPYTAGVLMLLDVGQAPKRNY